MDLGSLHVPQTDRLDLLEASTYCYIKHVRIDLEGVSMHGVPTPVRRQALSVHCGRLFPDLFPTPLSLFSSEVQKGELLTKCTLGCNGKNKQPFLENSARCRH